jgi:hypothetical protein
VTGCRVESPTEEAWKTTSRKACINEGLIGIKTKQCKVHFGRAPDYLRIKAPQRCIMRIGEAEKAFLVALHHKLQKGNSYYESWVHRMAWHGGFGSPPADAGRE